MALHSVLLPMILAVSLATTECYASSPGSRMDLHLHSQKNASGHWIIRVNAERSLVMENEREIIIDVHELTRLTANNELEQVVSMTTVYPPLHDTSMPGAIEPATTTPTTATPSTATTPSSTTTTATPSTATTPSSTTTTATPSTAKTTTSNTTCPHSAREEQLKAISKHTRQNRDHDQQVHAFEILEQPEILYPEGEEEELTDINMSNEQFRKAQQAMNIDQRQLSNFITESVKDQTNGDEKRDRILINGGGGTGKTFLMPLFSEYQLYPGYNCYKAFPSERKTWSEARQHCMRDGGDLMVIDSEREREDVFIPLYNSVYWFYWPWVGVHKAGNNWTTVKGEPALSTWWRPDYPRMEAAHKCAGADATGLLFNEKCVATRPFICEISL